MLIFAKNIHITYAFYGFFGGIFMATVLIRTAIIYILFIFAIRLMGKRQVGEMQLSELITTFMLSELAINPIQDISIPIVYSIIPLIFLLTMEVIMSFASTKSSKFKKLFMGTPSIIIRNGVLNQRELSRLRISMSELLSELRLKNVSSIEDVDFALVEQNGQLSVFLKRDKQTPTVGDLKEKEPSSGMAHALIMDGAINESGLELTGKSEKWLNSEICRRGLEVKDIFLFTVDENEKISVIPYD